MPDACDFGKLLMRCSLMRDSNFSSLSTSLLSRRRCCLVSYRMSPQAANDFGSGFSFSADFLGGALGICGARLVTVFFVAMAMLSLLFLWLFAVDGFPTEPSRIVLLLLIQREFWLDDIPNFWVSFSFCEKVTADGAQGITRGHGASGWAS